MKNKFKILFLFAVVTITWSSCTKEGPQGRPGRDGLDGQKGLDGNDGKDGLNATVYSSEWISPTDWVDGGTDWYFDVNAPDLTQDIVENSVVLAYAWLAGDLYDGTTMRLLPAKALGADWGFLIHEYGKIQFTSTSIDKPATIGNKFRFIAIPWTLTSPTTLKSVAVKDLKSMSYKEVCKLYNIPE